MSLENSPTKSIHRNQRTRMAPPPPPAHLSEFLSFVNGTSNTNASGERKNRDEKEEGDEVDSLGLNRVENDLKKKLKLSKRRSNLSTSTTTSNSNHINNNQITSSNSSMNWSLGSEMTATTMDLEVVLSKKDISDSLTQFKELEDASNKLSEGLKNVSELFGKFASVVENISRSKGSGEYCESLGAFSNYQYLVSNQHYYLSEILKSQFGDKISSIKSEFDEKHSNREAVFESEYKELVKQLKVSEKLESKLRRSKTRNLVIYKNNLNDLSNKLNEIDHVYHDYYVDTFEMLERSHGEILEHAKSIVQNESLVFDKLSEKTKPGNGLDGLINQKDSFIHDEDETFMDDTINGQPNDDQVHTSTDQNLENMNILEEDNQLTEQNNHVSIVFTDDLSPNTSLAKEEEETNVSESAPAEVNDVQQLATIFDAASIETSEKI